MKSALKPSMSKSVVHLYVAWLKPPPYSLHSSGTLTSVSERGWVKSDWCICNGHNFGAKKNVNCNYLREHSHLIKNDIKINH